MSLSPGTSLGHYDVTSLLGEGGMGQRGADRGRHCPMALAPGTRLGHYDVTALIGEGDMGQVWQATEAQLGRDVNVVKQRGTWSCDFPALSASELMHWSPSQPFRLWIGAVST